MENNPRQLLDNPVWHALTSGQAHLAQGAGAALRFHPEVGPFAAVADASPASLRALHDLLEEGEFAVLPTLAPLPSIAGLVAEQVGALCQMVAAAMPSEDGDDSFVQLGASDVPDMLALTQATKPGPFGPRTIEMGRYIGLRDGGRLVAMAGERMRLVGHTEISAVCVDESHRGRGLAGKMINTLRRDILQRGDIPFLHVFEHNHTAVALYEKLGFVTRRRFLLYRVSRGAS